MSQDLLVERDGPLTKLTLNRPQKLNALNTVLVEALIESLAEATTDGTRLVVFAGAGRGFSAGFDFGGLEDHSDGDLALRFLRLEMLLQAVYHAPFATLALVHGPCFGAAADLVVGCTHRIAAPDARFRMPGLQFGVILGTRRLSHVTGPRVTRELLSESQIFDSKKAVAVGFVDEIKDQSEWPDAIAGAQRAAAALPLDSQQALLRVTVRDTRDTDMANLARSIAAPGLRERIEAYVAAMRATSS